MNTQSSGGEGPLEPKKAAAAGSAATEKAKPGDAQPPEAQAAAPARGSADDLLTKLKEILPRVEAGGESGVTLEAVGTINSSNQYVSGDSYSQASTAARDVIHINIFGPPRDDLIRTPEDQRRTTGISPNLVFAGEVESWWESGRPTLDDLCHLVALAFLEGSDFKSIARHAAELRDRAENSSAALGQGAKRLAAASRIISDLGAYRARLNESRDRELVFFHDPAWRAKCLVSIWRDFAGSVLPVCDWLFSLANEVTGPTRVSLQQAIAILFTKFPDDIYQTVALPLADAGIPQRWLVANSFAIALRADGAESVRAKLRSAAHLSHGRSAASVAALCVGNAFAHLFPADAADFLIALLEHHQDMDDALGVAIEGIIREARSNPTSAEAILNHLAAWPRWDKLGPDIIGDFVAAHLRDSIEGSIGFAKVADAVRHFKRETELEAKAKKASFKFSGTAEILAVISAAILNPHIGRGKRRRDSTERDEAGDQSVACFAARDSKVSDVAGDLIIRLIRFGPTRVAAWSLLRDILRWSGREQAIGAVAIVKRVFSLATEQEQQRFQEHLKRWSREPAVHQTIEGYFQTAVSSSSNA